MSAPAAVETDRPFIVQLDAFSGPLDLLLHLIREQEIEITDIPIAKIADQFLEVIHSLGLDDAANYLEMAAWLVRIKVQMILPRPFDEENWEDPRAELVRRLLEYEQIREVSDWLAQQADLRSAQYRRGWVPELPQPEPPTLIFGLDDIIEAVETVLESIPQPVLHRVVPRPLDVEGATQRIKALLLEREELTFREVLTEQPTIADIISALIALLELARVGRLRLIQDKPFGLFSIARESTSPAD